MNELHKAYLLLGVEIGSPFETVRQRYRKLVKKWHPDVEQTADEKAFAEQELKNINRAFELLEEHFTEGEHKANGCQCQAGGAAPPPNRENRGGSRGPDPRPDAEAEARRREEEEAKRKDEERRRRAAEEEEARSREQELQQRRDRELLETAIKQEQTRNDEALRRKIAIGIMIAFLGIEALGFLSVSIKRGWHDVTTNWNSGGDKSRDSHGDGTRTDTGSTITDSEDKDKDKATAEPPQIVRNRVDDLEIRRASSWSTTTDSSGVSTVTGLDSAGRKIVVLYYGSDDAYRGHYVFSYYSSPASPGVQTLQVRKFNPMGLGSPGIFGNRCVGSCTYTFDSSSRLLSADSEEGSVQSSFALEYDSSGYLRAIRKSDFGRQNTNDNPTATDISNLSRDLSSFYFASELLIPKVSILTAVQSTPTPIPDPAPINTDTGNKNGGGFFSNDKWKSNPTNDIDSLSPSTSTGTSTSLDTVPFNQNRKSYFDSPGSIDRLHTSPLLAPGAENK